MMTFESGIPPGYSADEVWRSSHPFVKEAGKAEVSPYRYAFGCQEVFMGS